MRGGGRGGGRRRLGGLGAEAPASAMARNQEKSQMMLNRYLSAKAEAHGFGRKENKRPYLASESRYRDSDREA